MDVSEPRALTLDEIRDTINDYRTAAANARAAGFDGIEILIFVCVNAHPGSRGTQSDPADRQDPVLDIPSSGQE